MNGWGESLGENMVRRGEMVLGFDEDVGEGYG